MVKINILYQPKQVSERYYSNDLPDLWMKVDIKAIGIYDGTNIAEVSGAKTILDKYSKAIVNEWYEAEVVSDDIVKEKMWSQEITKDEQTFLDSITPKAK